MPRALTTTIGVGIPSARALSITLQPSRPGKHQVEDADVGLLEAEPRQALLALADDDGVESGRGQMPGHPVGDHRVVLDDQDLGHTRL